MMQQEWGIGARKTVRYRQLESYMPRMIALNLLLSIVADPLVAAEETTLDRFSMPFDVAGGDASQMPQGDLDDGPVAGPNFWEVKGLAAGKTANIRRALSASAPVVGKLS